MTDRTVVDILNRPIHSEGQDSQGVEVQVARPGKGEEMKKEKRIRVRAGNVPALVEAFTRRGIPVGVSTEVKSTLFGGCSDPSCCPQHESAEFPERWRTLILQASRKEIEEVFSDLRRKGAEEDADYADLRKLHGAGIPPGGGSERRWEKVYNSLRSGEEMPCNNCGATMNLVGEETKTHPNDVFCGDCSEKILRLDTALGRERRMFTREEPSIPVIFSKSPETLEAALQTISEGGPYAVVEAEYGDIEVRGTSEALTLNHHVRPEKEPPCLVELSPEEMRGVRAIGVSHFDLDTLGGVLEILGRKPYAPEFWAAAAFVDTKGPHRLQEHCKLGGKTHLQLAAFWSWSQAHRTPFLKEGELVGLNSLFEEAEKELSAILVWGEREEVGRTFLEKEDELKNSTFSEEMVVKTSNDREVIVVFRKGEVFVNLLYFREDGRPADIVVGYSTKMKSVTVSAAEEGLLHCREVVQAIWGKKAGGHPGIAGSPRDLEISEYSARRAYRRVCLEIGEVTLTVDPGCGPYVGEECVEEGVKVECVHRAVLDFHQDPVYGDDSVAFVTLRRVL